MSDYIARECPNCKGNLEYDIRGNCYKCIKCQTQYNRLEYLNCLNTGKKPESTPIQAIQSETQINERGEKDMSSKGKCVKCGREEMTIVAKGLCGKCYASERKPHKEIKAKKEPKKNVIHKEVQIESENVSNKINVSFDIEITISNIKVNK